MISQLVTAYLKVFPAEKVKLKMLLEQLEKKGEEGITSRRHFETGHVTAAGFILRKSDHAVLLIEHAFLKKLLQPGGHMEPEDATPLQTAYREVFEEVGFDRAQITYVPLLTAQSEIPFDIGPHSFPKRAEKDEPEHFHYDFHFLFMVDEQAQATLHPTEVTGVRWVSFDDFKKMPTFQDIPQKIETILAQRNL